MRRAATAAILGAALWLSAAVFAPVSSAPGSGWLAALPSWPALGAAIAGAALLVAWRPPSTRFALLPLVAILLPWVPGIDAGLIFAGPLVTLIWAAVIALGWGRAMSGPLAACGCTTSANRATMAAFLIALASTALIAWRVAPMVPGGDEPHYLIITQSLLNDGDLRIENNHAQRDFEEYATGDLHPQYLVRGRDGEIYPVHAPGLPALTAPAFAMAGYDGVVVFLLVVMALASALVWRLAWLATGDIGAAWFGWAAVAASCTWAFQSFLIFPDALGGAAVACGLWLVLRLDRRDVPAPMAIAAAGLALAMLPWLHTRFAVLAAGLGLMIVLRLYPLGIRHVVQFLAAPVAAAAGWFGFFQAIYGTPNPIAQWGSTEGSQAAWIPGGLAGLLFDQQFGLLPYAPALAAGFIGLAVGLRPGWQRATRAQLAVLIVAAYLAASASYAMWWAGLSVPARLLAVLLPVLAPGAAAVWQRAHTPALRATLAASLAWTIFATATLAFAERGLFAWNIRQHKAGLWFEWVAPLVDWTEGLPAFFRADDLLGRESLPLAPFHVVSAIWVAVMAGAIILAVVLSRAIASAAPRHARAAGAAVTITALLVALPVATVFSLRAQGADGSAPSRAQIAFLSRMAEGDAVVFDLGARRMSAAMPAATSLRISLPAVPGGRSRSLGSVPAGAFRIAGAPAGAPGDVVIGRAHEPVAALADAPLDIVLPVAVNALTVRGAAGRDIALQPLSVPSRRTQQKALRAMRYGAVTVYFLDDRVYAEPDAFWVGGARYAKVVLQGEPGAGYAELEIVNAPVENRVSVVGAAQPFDRDLMPGETVLVPVVLDARGSARLQIESGSGFIPADADPANQDRRYLGVYVKVR